MSLKLWVESRKKLTKVAKWVYANLVKKCPHSPAVLCADATTIVPKTF